MESERQTIISQLQLNIIQTQSNIFIWLKKHATGIKGSDLHSFLVWILLLTSVKWLMQYGINNQYYILIPKAHQHSYKIFMCIKNTKGNIIGSNTDLTYLKTEIRKVLLFASPVALYQLTGSQDSA